MNYVYRKALPSRRVKLGAPKWHRKRAVVTGRVAGLRCLCLVGIPEGLTPWSRELARAHAYCCEQYVVAQALRAMP